MELKTTLRNAGLMLKKYKYVLIVLLLGLILMIIPGKVRTTAKDNATPASENVKDEPDMDELLARILSEINGAGRVRVMLTQAEGEEIVFQTDTGSAQTDTVVITDADRAQDGLVKQIKPPVYRGAIVVCDGADNPMVRLAIVEAVSDVTGLGTNCISVFKMK